jgi:hypothetical protein
MKKRQKPKKLSLVRFDASWLSSKQRRAYPFKKNGLYLFLGEIANMPEHCAVVDQKSGRTYVGYHTENFVQLTQSDI